MATTRTEPINGHAARIVELADGLRTADVSQLPPLIAAECLLSLERARTDLSRILDAVRSGPTDELGPLFK